MTAHVFCFPAQDSADNGNYLEPHPELTFSKFVTPLLAQVAAVCPPKTH